MAEDIRKSFKTEQKRESKDSHSKKFLKKNISEDSNQKRYSKITLKKYLPQSHLIIEKWSKSQTSFQKEKRFSSDTKKK